MIKGVICDLDGFLVKTWGTEPLEGVLDTLAILRERGIKVAVATNQAGPLWRWATGEEKYPTVQEVASRLLTCASRLGLTDAPWFVALSDDRVRDVTSEENMQDMAETLSRGLAVALPSLPAHINHIPAWRKPAPGMIYAACNTLSLALHETIYGGDLDSDKATAEAAGVRFVNTLPAVLIVLEQMEQEAKEA